MTKYYGPIKTKAQADRLADRLEKNAPYDSKAAGAARMLRLNWHAVAARPAQAEEMVALAESLPMPADRPGSVAAGILAQGRGDQAQADYCRDCTCVNICNVSLKDGEICSDRTERDNWPGLTFSCLRPTRPNNNRGENMPNQQDQQAGRRAGHTPGPWAIEGPHSPKVESAVIKGASGMVAYCHGRCYAEAEANAALIAAAPDLLAALKGLQKQIHAHYKMNVKKDFSLMLADAEAGKAIAKAEGQA